MIGTKQLVIGAADFVKGVSTSSDVSDGGFSPETDNVNLTANPGTMYAPAASVDSDTDVRLTGNIIASSPDMNVTSPTNRLFVTDDGKAYRYNGTKLDAAGIALTAAQTWTASFTDIITFAGEAYVSSRDSLTRWQNDNTIDAGASWPFSFANSVPHPGVVYENSMYWGDKNLLKIQSTLGDAVAPTTVLTLSTDQVIVALGVDPGSGLMLISTTNALDASATLTSVNRVLWYDGNSAKVSKSAIIEDAILGFHCVGGTVFVGYSNKVGYLSGAGIQYLRTLNNVTASNTELPYKHHFAHVGNTLYVLNGKQVMAYGEVLPGRKVWYPAWSNMVNSNKPTCLADVGAKKLGMGFATTKFYTFDTSSVATTNNVTFYTNEYDFPRPVFLRSVYLEYSSAVINGDANRTIYYQSEDKQTGFQILRVQGLTSGTGLINSSGASVYFIDNVIGFASNKVRSVQFRYGADTVASGLKRIILYWDPAE